jgi:hypothetical protein
MIRIADMASLRRYYEEQIQDLKDQLDRECHALADYKKVTEPRMLEMRVRDEELTRKV